MKGRTGSKLSRTIYVKCFRVETSCYYRLVSTELHRDCGITVDPAESDLVQCQTKMRAFASRFCSELKQIELNWNRKKNCSSKCFMESGLLYDPTMKQTNLRAGWKSALQPGTMTGRRSETFEDLLCVFSLPRISTRDFPYIKGKIDWSIVINYSSVDFKWTQVFLCCQSFDRLRSMNFFKNMGHIG